MGQFSFLNPAFLGAIGLVAIPILLHLIRRKRLRIIPWAAWEFLKLSERRTNRRLRIEQLLLLLVRVLILLLVVLAFCRPLLRAAGLGIMGSDAHVEIVLAIDNSFSMAASVNGRTAFERAKEVALGVVNKIARPGDSVSIVLISAKPDVLLKEATRNLESARNRINAAALSDYGTDFAAGAATCLSVLDSRPGMAREIYWITDSQQIGWPDATGGGAKDAFKRLTAAARVTWIDVSHAEGLANTAVGAPRSSRDLITARTPVRIETTLFNYGHTARPGVLAHLEIDKRAVGARRVDLPADGKATAEFVYLFDKPGPHVGRVYVEVPDALQEDNSAWFAARVVENVEILVINGAPSSDPARDSAFYVATALAPTGASQGGAAASLRPTVKAGSISAEQNLGAYAAVVVTGAASLSAEDLQALERYASHGGGVLLFPRTDGAAWSADPLLAGQVRPRPASEEGQGVSLDPATIRHPALESLRDTSVANLGSAQMDQTVDLPTGGEPRVAVRFSDGRPAIIERTMGSGTVMMAAFGAGSAGSTLPFKPAYVPLIHQLTSYLASRSASRTSLRVGEALVGRLPIKGAPRQIRLGMPSGAEAVVPVALGIDGADYRFERTGKAGIYRPTKPASVRDVFSVNRDPVESNLEPTRPDRIAALVAPAPVQFASATDDLVEVAKRGRKGAEGWRALVYAVLPLLFLEALLAQRFGRRA